MALSQWLGWVLEWAQAWGQVLSSTETTNSTVHLPQELIAEILLRLPVKSLVRCKCVCKSWLSLISDPHFATSHFELAIARTQRLALFPLWTVSRELELFLSIDFNASLYDDSARAALNLGFLSPEPFRLRIRGSCRGFLLLDCHRSLWVWNPCTGEHKKVCYSLNQPRVFLSGLGYDASTDDYLVVQLSNPVKNGLDVKPNCVEFFSLRANAWKEMEATHLTYSNVYGFATELISHKELFLNGAIHWLTNRVKRGVRLVIVAFDLTERSFSEIQLPPVFVEVEFAICGLTVLGGLLSLCGEVCEGMDFDILVLQIWVMKEYKVESSWTKTIVVPLVDIPTGFFYPICSTESGDIVGTGEKDILMKCNDKGQFQERRSYGKPEITESAVYTESLLSLPCDS